MIRVTQAGVGFAGPELLYEIIVEVEEVEAELLAGHDLRGLLARGL